MTDIVLSEVSPRKSVSSCRPVRIGLALEGDAEAANGLDPREGLLAFLLADGVAEQLAEQTDVLDQRQFLCRNIVRRCQSERICHRSLFGALSRSFA